MTQLDVLAVGQEALAQTMIQLKAARQRHRRMAST
jgi:hypothetical protein